MKKILATILSFAMTISAVQSVFANTSELSEDIVILYTNDVHTYIDGDLSYDVISAIKKDLQKKYKHVFLLDAGDHIQGTAYGSMDKGTSVIEMMNKAEYDVATLGNHEFDYGMSGCMNAIELADFPYVSANFYRVDDGKRTDNVLESFKIFDCGDEKLAVIGITTPETFEKSTTAYFQDENGNFIYGISGGTDGAALQKDVQNAIDDAKAEGATQLIALGHLGVDKSSSPWTSEETIAAVSGLDAFIDGHSHTSVEMETVKDKDGENVVLTQTGSYFERIGMMVINSETKEITTDFIECEEITENDGETVAGKKLKSDLYDGEKIISDSSVKEIKDKWIEQIDEKLGEKIGSADITLNNYDENGERLVRSQETNSGDFAADALYYLFDDIGMDVDAAIMNGGGVRNTAISGDISYKTCKDMHTFGNVACLQEVTGQQLLDALEWGARKLGVGENGGFLQVSGITYKVNTTIPNTVREDEIGTWTGAPDNYRVYDVAVYNRQTDMYEALDLKKKYNLAGYNYTLRNLGDGYAMFDGAVNILDYVMEDYMVLANYVNGFEDDVIKGDNSPLKEKYPSMLIDYNEIGGSGRIEITEQKYTDVPLSAWYAKSVDFAASNGLMNGVTDTEFAPENNLTRAMLVTILYRAELEPSVNKSISFSDVSAVDYFANAVNWAKQNEIVNGVDENNFAPNDNITREQIAAVMFRYALFKGRDTAVGGMEIHEFDDSNTISDYAKPAMSWAVNSGIIGGANNALNPKKFATRAEAAAILSRFIQQF